MRASTLAALAGLAAAVAGAPAWAQKGIAPTTVQVGGAAMASDQALMDDLPSSGEHAVFVGLLRASGLADTLKGRGPYTVFAPTDAAFAALPAGTVDTLSKPENKARLAALMSAQIVEGNYSVARLRFLMRNGKGGQADLDTLGGGKLGVLANGPVNIVVRDAKGSIARIVVYEVKQANGVVFVTDRVLMPG